MFYLTSLHPLLLFPKLLHDVHLVLGIEKILWNWDILLFNFIQSANGIVISHALGTIEELHIPLHGLSKGINVLLDINFQISECWKDHLWRLFGVALQNFVSEQQSILQLFLRFWLRRAMDGTIQQSPMISWVPGPIAIRFSMGGVNIFYIAHGFFSYCTEFMLSCSGALWGLISFLDRSFGT